MRSSFAEAGAVRVARLTAPGASRRYSDQYARSRANSGVSRYRDCSAQAAASDPNPVPVVTPPL